MIIQQPGLTVSAAARRAKVSRPLASLSLRALEARGLLKVQRRGRWVRYWPVTKSDAGPNARLAMAVTTRLRQAPGARQEVYRLATAFAHAGRIDVFRALAHKDRTVAGLKHATGLPGRTLLRHLQKLEARGFVQHTQTRPRRYTSRKHNDAFGQSLAMLAMD